METELFKTLRNILNKNHNIRIETETLWTKRHNRVETIELSKDSNRNKFVFGYGETQHGALEMAITKHLKRYGFDFDWLYEFSHFVDITKNRILLSDKFGVGVIGFDYIEKEDYKLHINYNTIVFEENSWAESYVGYDVLVWLSANQIPINSPLRKENKTIKENNNGS